MTDQRLLDMLRDRPDALGSKQVFTDLLKDYFPQERAMVQVMSVLYDMGIHTEIASAGRVTKDIAHRFAKRLVDERGIDDKHAKDTTNLFCACYAQFLGKPCDIAKASGNQGSEQRPKKAAPGAAAQATQSSPPPGKRMAIASLAVGIISVGICVIVPLLSIVPSVLGGWLGLKAKRHPAGRGTFNDLAMVGIVLSSIALVAGVLMSIAYFVGLIPPVPWAALPTVRQTTIVCVL